MWRPEEGIVLDFYRLLRCVRKIERKSDMRQASTDNKSRIYSVAYEIAFTIVCLLTVYVDPKLAETLAASSSA